MIVLVSWGSFRRDREQQMPSPGGMYRSTVFPGMILKPSSRKTNLSGTISCHWRHPGWMICLSGQRWKWMKIGIRRPWNRWTRNRWQSRRKKSGVKGRPGPMVMRRWLSGWESLSTPSLNPWSLVCWQSVQVGSVWHLSLGYSLRICRRPCPVL